MALAPIENRDGQIADGPHDAQATQRQVGRLRSTAFRGDDRQAQIQPNSPHSYNEFARYIK